MEENPKLAGSSIIDCIPQTGECPIGCQECFYNGKFYRTLDEPLIPTPQEAQGKIVRMNSGHDSNIDRNKVIEVARQYEDVFFNTSTPRFDFPNPVVFTCNGSAPWYINCPPNVMFVRVRVNAWEFDVQDRLVDYYTKQDVPVVLTFMRYYDQHSVKCSGEEYQYQKHILNSYWSLTPEAQLSILKRYKGTGVRTCGTPVSSYCKDCRNCEFLYWECKRRLS